LKKLDLDKLIELNNKILIQKPLKTLKPNKKYYFAIDFTNDPYYGKIDSSNEKYVIRGQAKKSSNSFYSYVSLYIINNNERFTISVLPVEKDKSKVYYLNYFINLIKILCLDREFYKTPHTSQQGFYEDSHRTLHLLGIKFETFMAMGFIC